MKKKRQIILFIEAGASRACGYPLTGDILPESLRRLRENEFNDEHINAHSVALKRFLSRLVPESGRGLLPQITELLSIIDYCLESGEELLAASRTTLKLTDARWLLERAISRVIKRIHPREAVPREIWKWSERLRKLGADVRCISTNYDFSLHSPVPSASVTTVL